MRVDPVLVAVAVFGAWMLLRVSWWLRCALYRKKPIPTWMWREVMERGGWRCANRWCRATSSLQADHKWPEWWFGPTAIWNLQPLCARCNRRKGARVKLPLLPWWLFWLSLGAIYRRR